MDGRSGLSPAHPAVRRCWCEGHRVMPRLWPRQRPRPCRPSPLLNTEYSTSRMLSRSPGPCRILPWSVSAFPSKQTTLVKPHNEQAFAATPPHLPAGGSPMRSYMVGFTVLGLLAVGTMAPASAHPLSVPPSGGHSSAIQQAEWDGCGPRCQEHRREMRVREHEYQPSQHRRWEEHRDWNEGRRYSPQAYDYQRRY
jgi:hypothetical protein